MAGARPAAPGTPSASRRRGELELLRDPRAAHRGALGRGDARRLHLRLQAAPGCSRATPRSVQSLPPDLRDGVDVTPRGRVRLTPELEDALLDRTCEAVAPLEQAGKLGAFLLQLTPAFSPDKHELDELDAAARRSSRRAPWRSSSATAAGCTASARRRRFALAVRARRGVRGGGRPARGGHVPIMPTGRRRHARRPRLHAHARPQRRGLHEGQERGGAVRLGVLGRGAARRSRGACEGMAEQAARGARGVQQQPRRATLRAPPGASAS